MSLRTRGVGRLGTMPVVRLMLALVLCLALGATTALAADPVESSTPASRPGSTGPPVERVDVRRLGRPTVEYDDADVFGAKVGSKYGYVKGPVAGPYGLLTADAPISTDGSSLTFWVYIDAHKNYRYILGSIWCGATIGTYWLRIGLDRQHRRLHEQDRRPRLHRRAPTCPSAPCPRAGPSTRSH